MDVELAAGVPADLRDQAAEVFFAGFGAKLRRVLGDDERARAFWAAAMAEDGTTLAVDPADRRVLGLMATTDRGHRATDNEWACARAVYGPAAAILRLMLLSVMQHRHRPGELHLEFLAVSPVARSRGVGSRLLQRADEIARERGMERVTLEVIASNPRARALYERSGFWVTETHRMGPVSRRLVGCDAYDVMVRPLRPAR